MRLALPSRVLLSVSIVACAGCSSLGLKQSLDSELEQVRDMRAQLEADWQAIGTSLDAVESDLVAFGSHQIDTTKVDPAVVSEAVATMEVPEEVTADDIAVAQKQAETALASYEKAIAEMDADLRATLEDVRVTGTRLSKQLYVELPASLADISSRASGMAVELAKIKGTAEQTEAMAEKNPLMTDADEAELNADQAELDKEIDALADLAKKIADESKDYGNRLTAATAKFQVELTSLTD